MVKPNLFLDFDGTIVNSSEAICTVYNEIYQKHPDFTPAIWQNNKIWSMKDVCPLVENVNLLFSDERFFKIVNFLEPETKEIMEDISKYYNIIIATIGIARNIQLKSQWIQDNVPFVQKTIMLQDNNCKMTKDLINMRQPRAVFIDDVFTNLESSNCPAIYTIGKSLPWNEKCELSGIKRLKNWQEAHYVLLNHLKEKNYE